MSYLLKFNQFEKLQTSCSGKCYLKNGSKCKISLAVLTLTDFFFFQKRNGMKESKNSGSIYLIMFTIFSLKKMSLLYLVFVRATCWQSFCLVTDGHLTLLENIWAPPTLYHFILPILQGKLQKKGMIWLVLSFHIVFFNHTNHAFAAQ